MKRLERQQCAYRIVASWDADALKSAEPLSQGYPVMLRALGTMQTLAFSMGKKEIGHPALASAIAVWVLSRESGAPVGEVAEERRTPKELLGRLSKASRASYLAADLEAIAFADAIKTIAKALRRGS